MLGDCLRHRATHPYGRSLLRVSALCVGIAIALAGCKIERPQPNKLRECVDTAAHEVFRYHTANVAYVGGLFSDAAVITDDEGFERLYRNADHLKCRDVPAPKGDAQ
jgi:hypothetical protein